MALPTNGTLAKYLLSVLSIVLTLLGFLAWHIISTNRAMLAEVQHETMRLSGKQVELTTRIEVLEREMERRGRR